MAGRGPAPKPKGSRARRNKDPQILRIITAQPVEQPSLPVIEQVVLDENGKTQVVTMGSYGIGVTRVMAALAEANCDDKGLSWPAQIAPFDVHVLATGKGDEVFETAQSLGEQLDAAGLDVLVDDRRKVSAGVKFKDYELVGVPFGLVVGRSLADGEVEIRVRATGETIVVPVEEAVARLRDLHAAALKGE